MRRTLAGTLLAALLAPALANAGIIADVSVTSDRIHPRDPVHVTNALRVAQSTTPASPDDYSTPARGSKERAAMMDAARGPVSSGIGQTVIFVISTLRTDGEWAYLQATPKNPDGSDLDWSKTLLADEWEAGMMDDVVMVLLRKTDGQWTVVDHVIGPTDVFWYNWVESYGLPELLFNPG